MDINNIAILNTEKPEVTFEISNGASYVNVPYIISEENGLYKYISFTVAKSEYTYGNLVSYIISLHYKMQEVFAIMNNYLADPDNSEYKKEFEELQRVRKAAKEYVKTHFTF